MKTPISEMFTSFQGTGSLAGQKQFFVRFQGCSIKCPIRHICDEPSALPMQGDNFVDTDELVEKALKEVGEGGWIHITGGEPLQHLEAWDCLVDQSMKAGLRVQTQTSGLIDHGRSMGRAGRITVSPKADSSSLQLKNGTEMVLVAAPWVTAQIAFDLMEQTCFDFYYIVPAHLGNSVWSINHAVELTLQLHLEGQSQWRLSHQLHKLFGIR